MVIMHTTIQNLDTSKYKTLLVYLFSFMGKMLFFIVRILPLF